MSRQRFKGWMTGLFALLLAVSMTACESPTSAIEETETADEELVALSTTLTQELGLSATQQQDLNASMARNGGGGRMHEPGFLWAVAAHLQATLTDEQKERLLARAAEFAENGRGFGPGGFRGGPGGPGGFRGLGGQDGRGPNGGGCFGDVLTEDQQAAIEAIRETYRPQIEALIEAVRNEDITREEFREQIEALEETIRAEVDALLSDEQRSAIEACIEERRAEAEAAREERKAQELAAMVAALSLSADQEAALTALIEQLEADRAAIFEQVMAETLSREDAHAALEALEEDKDAALEALLDDTQWEIVQIHDALALRARGFGRRGQDGRRGGPFGDRRGDTNG